MDKYFAGTLPFCSVKARTDIPDAFIVETILDLASQGELFAVADDAAIQPLRTAKRRCSGILALPPGPMERSLIL